jgi:hypothetical protein
MTLFRTVVVTATMITSTLTISTSPASADTETPAAGSPRAGSRTAPISIVQSAKLHGVEGIAAAIARQEATVSLKLADEPEDCQFVWFRSAHNGLYVSAENGTSRNLRARATELGPWEEFEICFYSDGTVDLTSMNSDLMVSAEMNLAGDNRGTLRARATERGPWERFTIGLDGPDKVVLHSEAAGAYVSAEFGWSGSATGTLRARATTIGPWEKFGE